MSTVNISVICVTQMVHFGPKFPDFSLEGKTSLILGVPVLVEALPMYTRVLLTKEKIPKKTAHSQCSM